MTRTCLPLPDPQTSVLGRADGTYSFKVWEYVEGKCHLRPRPKWHLPSLKSFRTSDPSLGEKDYSNHLIALLKLLADVSSRIAGALLNQSHSVKGREWLETLGPYWRQPILKLEMGDNSSHLLKKDRRCWMHRKPDCDAQCETLMRLPCMIWFKYLFF